MPSVTSGPRSYKEQRVNRQVELATSKRNVSRILEDARAKKSAANLHVAQDQKRRILKTREFALKQRVHIKNTKLFGRIVSFDGKGNVLLQVGSTTSPYNVTVIEAVR